MNISNQNISIILLYQSKLGKIALRVLQKI